MHEALCRSPGTTLDILHVERRAADHSANIGSKPPSLREAFKISGGKSPHQFVMERRVQHALELLRNEDRSIAEIAHAVGFSSQSRLTENFRRVTGLTPGQFRRSLG